MSAPELRDRSRTPVYVRVDIYTDWRADHPGATRTGRPLTEIEWIAARFAHELWHVDHLDNTEGSEPSAGAFGTGFRSAMGWQ